MSDFIDFLNGLDSSSVFTGFVLCMVFDVFNGLSSFLVEKAFDIRSRRKFKKSSSGDPGKKEV